MASSASLKTSTTTTTTISLFVESTVPSKRKKIKLSDWPTTSSFCCYYCCHTFRTVPIPMVHNEFEFDKQIFHICGEPTGVFCSVTCLIGFISNSNLNRVQLNHNAKMIQLYWSRYFQFEEKECSLEPRPRYLLKMFGGSMNIEEFRRGSCRFIDKRPDSKTVQSVQSRNSEKDLMLWPILYPHLETMPVPTHVPGLNAVPLTSMDDPSEAIIVSNAVHVPTPSTVTQENRTVTMISDILQQTIDTKKLQDISDTLSGMSLTSAPPTTPPRPSNRRKTDSKSPAPTATATQPRTTTMMQTNNNKTPKQEPKRRKVKVNSPPITYNAHPLFGGARSSVRGK